MAFRDHEAEQARLRSRLVDVVTALSEGGITQPEITAEAQRKSWSTIYRQLKGDARVDPLVVERLERAFRQIQDRKARTQFGHTGVRMVSVVGETGSRATLYPQPTREIPVREDLLERGAEYAAIAVTEDDDALGLEAGEDLIYEVGALPSAGQMAVFDVDGKPEIRRCARSYRRNGLAPLGVVRRIATFRDP